MRNHIESGVTCRAGKLGTVRRVLLMAGVLAMAAGGQSAHAQGLEEGARLRVRADKVLVGTYLGVTADTLRLEMGPGNTGVFSIPLSNVRRLDVSIKRRRNIGRGMLIGGAAGTIIGGVLGYATKPDCQPSGEWGLTMGPCTRSEQAVVGAVLLGGLGIVMGGVLGIPRSDKWQQVAIP